MAGSHPARRLAGISFDPVKPPLKEMLPRMDVAVFVGFAAKGHFHEPLPVESVAQFVDKFGKDLPLAWDSERGEQVCAYLAPAVRSFFANGGQRCWVIRVGDPIDQDGHAQFSANLFLDRELKEKSAEDLMAHADFLRYQSSVPRKLKGIHAALEIEEATIIAVPDAVHLGWKFTGPDEQMVPAESLPLFRPEWWRFDCNLTQQELRVEFEKRHLHEPDWHHFLDCGLHAITAPVFKDKPLHDEAAGTYTLKWSEVPDATYMLEEATRPDWSGAVVIYEGKERSLELRGYPPGDYYYRVCAEVKGIRSDWSPGKRVRLSPSRRWQLKSSKRYSSRSLLMIHRALLQMCAARGDLFAVLSMPVHFREDAALRHARELRSTAGMGRGELSFAALYHPWLISRDDGGRNRFRHVPPDGAICGMIAQRAMARGAWVAPANDTLKDVVALTPPILSHSRLRLLESQINLIRREPRGFVTMSADTLSDDADLRPINVRRLLMLLRRLALRQGAQYVFEPNDDAFRRMVQRGFEAMLDDMFMRGAFSGATPAAAYQVVTGRSLNTPQSVEQGRFIVELKVSPAQPMTFLTIQLLQTGDRMSIVEGR